MRSMFDSVSPSAIYHTVKAPDLVAGYVDGLFAWSEDDFNLWPQLPHVRITVNPEDSSPWKYASVIDVEAGAHTLLDAAVFIPLRNRFRPGTATVYISKGLWPQLQRVCAGLEYKVWLADWTGVPPTQPPAPNVVAVQWTSNTNWDRSVVFDDDWHRTQK